ncbi:MAG: UvrB/UvrC motif-containing protein [Planctomycetes bacterium]|nr:UvrB/UvrC motif-containing protein [Planctomycetota bacterium]
MTCERCKKKEAVRHESVRQPDGSWAELHLCDTCAEGDVTLLTPSSFVQALMGAAGAGAPRAAPGVRACPHCGITYAEFRTRGRLGCPGDYEIFQGELMPLLERIHHGGAQHVGKSPSTADGRSEVERELIELRRAQADAVQREQYEEAAALRDRIRALEERAAGGGAADPGGKPPGPPPGPPTPPPPKGRGGKRK